MMYVPDKPDPTPVEKLKKRVAVLENELAATKEELVATKMDVVDMKQMVFDLLEKVSSLEALSKVGVVSSSAGEPDLPDGISLPFKGTSFGKEGLIFYIGSEGNTTVFKNPGIKNGSMEVTMSSISHGSFAFKFLDHCADGVNATCDYENSWMKVDIGAHRRFSVEHYSLRHGGSSSTTAGFLRHWRFEASHCGDEWVTLKSHINDCTLDGPYKVGDWPIRPLKESYRFFRIFQTKINGRGDNHLFCAGIELYGVLTNL